MICILQSKASTKMKFLRIIKLIIHDSKTKKNHIFPPSVGTFGWKNERNTKWKWEFTKCSNTCGCDWERPAWLAPKWLTNNRQTSHFSIDNARQLDSYEIDRYCCKHKLIHMEIVTQKIAQEKYSEFDMRIRNELKWLLASGAQMTIGIIMSHLCNKYMNVSKFRLILLFTTK